ncbi:pyridoxal-dependent decarboxylase [Scenedesmus sp. NREL 46B-D3]|nr:pyridoxal-dependent decarboxylase [Scenedesmus sp. NREL 46B-D3]
MVAGCQLDCRAGSGAAGAGAGVHRAPGLQEAASQQAAAAARRASAVSSVLQQYGALQVASGNHEGIADAALRVIGHSGVADTFYVYDLGEVARLHATWVETMPRVAPFYAVKCNPEPGMVAMLNALGAGFDCASVQELKCAAAHDVPQDRVIFANPCKRPADFRYARENGVEYTTFDCVSELDKIAVGYPAFKCVLRIRCDDADAKINLGLKYGADLTDVPMLLGMACHLGLQVVGVSFHVGSGCQNVGVYADAIAAAREAFDIAATYGFNMELLDVGGGFTAPYDEPTTQLFYQTAGVINGALERCFPVGCGVRIIAEPGRYFAETSATLFTTILGQRDRRAADGRPFRDYWLSDGTYGSFRIQVAVDGLEPNYSVLRSPLLPPPTADEAHSLLHCRLWGNSDRDGDVVHKAALLPPLRDGDWLMFPYAGAYTICAASNYGGVCFTQPLKVFVHSAEALVRDSCEHKMALTLDSPDVAEDDSVDSISCDRASCGGGALDAAGTAVEGCGLLLLHAGSGSENGAVDNFDCMSVASEATGLGAEAYCGSGAAEAEMGEACYVGQGLVGDGKVKVLDQEAALLRVFAQGCTERAAAPTNEELLGISTV